MTEQEIKEALWSLVDFKLVEAKKENGEWLFRVPKRLLKHKDEILKILDEKLGKTWNQ